MSFITHGCGGDRAADAEDTADREKLQHLCSIVVTVPESVPDPFPVFPLYVIVFPYYAWFSLKFVCVL